MSETVPTMPQTCSCHGMPWPKCPMFGPLLQEEAQTPSSSAKPPSATKEKRMSPKKATKTERAEDAPKKKQSVHRHQEDLEVRVAIEDPAKREEILQSMLLHMKSEIEVAAEAKNIAKGYREKLNTLAETIEEERLALKEGEPTMRPCEITRNFNASAQFPNGRYMVKDRETGAVYEDRELTDADAQLPISDLPTGEESEGDENA